MQAHWLRVCRKLHVLVKCCVSVSNASTLFAHTQDKPVFFVFHGGSGSEKDKIHEALQNGVIKMNIDTDIQV